MSNAVFPNAIRGLTYPVHKRPTWNTLVQTSPNRYELRLAQDSMPIWQWKFEFEYLKDAGQYDIQSGFTYTDFKTLLGFFLQRNGRFDDFLYLDVDDQMVGGGYSGGTLGTAQSLALVNNGPIYYSPLQRNLGGFMEDLTDLQPAGGNDHSQIKVYANGVLQTYGVNYTIPPVPGLAIGSQSYVGLYLQWLAQPAPPIKANFNFYFRVCYDGDEQDFTKFMDNLWAMGGKAASGGGGTLQLISVRPAIA